MELSRGFQLTCKRGWIFVGGSWRSASLTLQIPYILGRPLFAKPNFTLQCKFHLPTQSQRRVYSRGNRGSTIPPSFFPFRCHACCPTGVKTGENFSESAVNWFLNRGRVLEAGWKKQSRLSRRSRWNEGGFCRLSDAFNSIIRPSEFVKRRCFDWLNFIRYWILVFCSIISYFCAISIIEILFEKWNR